MMRCHIVMSDRRNASIHEGFARVIPVTGSPGSVDNFAKHQLS